MGRIKGSKNKRKQDIDGLHAIDATQEIATATIANDSKVDIETTSPFPFDLILGIRKLPKDHMFPGLWQIVEIKDGLERVLVDATSKQSVMNVARTQIARCI